MLVLLRVSMAMFDAPARTMVAELTADYDKRTRLAALPTSASWFIGALMTIAMYGPWLKDTPDHLSGQTYVGGYQQAGLAAGVVILASLLFILCRASSRNSSSAPTEPGAIRGLSGDDSIP